MPSKMIGEVEYCFPCKWWRQKLVKSGQQPIYEARCNHLTQSEYAAPFGSRGRIIDGDYRPKWCPIRGDTQAEKEAEVD